MTTGRANGPATVMWIARSLLACLLVIASTNPAAAQHDTANAGALDGFAGAIATAGVTVAKAICTPLQRQDSIVLYDAATGQRLQSTCQVTGKIEEFLQGAPEQIATGLEYFANQVNDTVGFFQYMKSTAFGIAEHLVDNFRDLENLSKKAPVNLTPAVERLIHHVRSVKDSDPDCTPATVYPGAQIPTQCVGPVFELVFSGGSCTEDPDSGEVACMPASVTLQKTPGGCNLKYTSSDVIQDRYCAMSTTYGNSTTGTFKHPAEIFNFQKLLSVPNPFNIDLSLYTATAAASASPIKPPKRPPFPQVPSMAPAPGPAPGPVQGPASGPGASPGSSGGDSGGYSSSGSYSDSGDYGSSLSSSAGGGSTPSEPDFTVYPEAPVTAPTGLQAPVLASSGRK